MIKIYTVQLHTRSISVRIIANNFAQFRHWYCTKISINSKVTAFPFYFIAIFCGQNYDWTYLRLYKWHLVPLLSLRFPPLNWVDTRHSTLDVTIFRSTGKSFSNFENQFSRRFPSKMTAFVLMAHHICFTSLASSSQESKKSKFFFSAMIMFSILKLSTTSVGGSPLFRSFIVIIVRFDVVGVFAMACTSVWLCVFHTKFFSYDYDPRVRSVSFGNRNGLGFPFFLVFILLCVFVCSSSRIYLTNVV